MGNGSTERRIGFARDSGKKIVIAARLGETLRFSSTRSAAPAKVRHDRQIDKAKNLKDPHRRKFLSLLFTDFRLSSIIASTRQVTQLCRLSSPRLFQFSISPAGRNFEKFAYASLHSPTLHGLICIIKVTEV